MNATASQFLQQRFRGFLPVIVDVETGGFNPHTDALLEIAAVRIDFDAQLRCVIKDHIHHHVQPFPGANIEPEALAITGIKPFHPLRFAKPEKAALIDVFKPIREQLKSTGCQRAVLVGHNATFDLAFLKAALQRTQMKRSPFHPFTTLDTASLGALAVGQTVLAKAVRASGMRFDGTQAHSALYDATKTAELFCHIVNQWQDLGGWAPAHSDSAPTT